MPQSAAAGATRNKKKKPVDPLHPWNIMLNFYASRVLLFLSGVICFACLIATSSYPLVNDPYRLRLTITVLQYLALTGSMISMIFLFTRYLSARRQPEQQILYVNLHVLRPRLANIEIVHDFAVMVTTIVLVALLDRNNLCKSVPSQPITSSSKGNEFIYFCNEYKGGYAFGVISIILYVWAVIQDYANASEIADPEEKNIQGTPKNVQGTSQV